MIQLAAYNQTSNLKQYLDIDADENVSLTYQVSEIKDFSSKDSSRSDTFSLPFTETNNQFFSHLYNVNMVDGSFDVYQKTDCEIIVDGISIISGYLYVADINLVSEYYTVVVIGEIGSLRDSLQEKKLIDLDSTWLSSFTHNLTKDNIVDSWDFNLTYAGTAEDASGIVYAFINYGIDSRVWTVGGSQDISSSSTPIQPYEFKPAMRIKTLFDRILSEAGYSYDSNFITNDDFEFGRLFMNLASDRDIVAYRITSQGFKSLMTADQKIATNSSTTIQFNNDSTGGGYDYNTQFNTGTYQFTASKDGTYQFVSEVLIEFTRNDASSETSTQYQFDWLINGGTTSASKVYTIAPASDGETVQVRHRLPAYANLNNLDTIQLNITVSDPISPNTFYVRQGSTPVSYLQLLRQPDQPNGEVVDVSDNLPDMTQIDFVKAIFEHFNMFVEPKQDNPTELLIEPYPDYMDRGSTVDWTEKLDYNKEVQIIPTTDYRKKKLTWKWLDGKNYLATYAQEVREKPYGYHTYEDESELTDGEFVNFTVFGEPTGQLLRTAAGEFTWDVVVMDLSGRDQNGNVVISKDVPRMFYVRKIDISNTYYLYDEATTTADATTSYGYAGHYSDIPATTGVIDLNWGVKSPIYNYGSIVTEPTFENPFFQYWKPYLNELYSPESRILKGKFFLNPVDIHNLRFNNKIFIRDTYYRINKITNYKPNSTEPCDVELIKIFDTKVGLGNICDDVPAFYNDDGSVTFVDGDGNEVTVSRSCCRSYGYLYVTAGDNSGCYWRNPLGNNADPNEPTPFESGG